MDVLLPTWLRCMNLLSSGPCGGTLVGYPGELRCTQCAYRYMQQQGIPLFLLQTPLKGQSGDHYGDDAIIRTYYEAQFGKFIIPSAELALRLPLPAHLQGRDELPTTRKWVKGWEPAALAASSFLTTSEHLTEPFYQGIRELIAPFVAPGMQILDVGCGLGRMTGELAALTDGTVFGVDRSPRMIREATRLVTVRGPHEVLLNAGACSTVPAQLDLDWQYDNVGFMVADALSLPIANDAIDLVLCLNLLDRVARPRQLIAELQRVLRAEGLLIIADPYHWDEKYTPVEQWVEDMRAILSPVHWTIEHEVVSLPFVMRYEPRRITTYQNHCLVCRKSGGSARRGRSHY